MRTSSPDESTVELVLAEADAFTAIEGTVQALATLGLVGCAAMIDILGAAALRHQPFPQWGLLAEIVESLTGPLERRPTTDPKRKPGLDALAALYVAVLDADECRRHRALVTPGAVA